MFLSVPTSCAVSRTSRRRSIVGLEGICGRPQTFDGGLGTTLAAQPGGVRLPRRFSAAFEPILAYHRLTWENECRRTGAVGG
jgi:hypothetical protein